MNRVTDILKDRMAFSFEVFPGVDRSEAAFLPFVVVANHLRPEQGLDDVHEFIV